MQRVEVSGAVRPLYWSLGVKGLSSLVAQQHKQALSGQLELLGLLSHDRLLFGHGIYLVGESWWGNRRERDHWGDLGVDGWMILGWISRRWGCGYMD